MDLKNYFFQPELHSQWQQVQTRIRRMLNFFHQHNSNRHTVCIFSNKMESFWPHTVTEKVNQRRGEGGEVTKINVDNFLWFRNGFS